MTGWASVLGSMRRSMLIAVMLAIALTGCGPGAKDKALRSTLAGVNAARAAFVVWDGAAQDRIVAEAQSLEAGKAALAEHREHRAVLVTAFEGAYYSLAIAATDLEDINLAQAAVAATTLYTLYRQLVGTDPPKGSP